MLWLLLVDAFVIIEQNKNKKTIFNLKQIIDFKNVIWHTDDFREQL